MLKRLCTVLAILLASAGTPAAAQSVGATRAWTSNYVARVLAPVAAAAGNPSAISNLVRDVVAAYMNAAAWGEDGPTNNLTATAGGKTLLYMAATAGGEMNLDAREVSIAFVQTNSPPCLGCRVVSSGVAAVSTGTVFAVAADGLRVRNVASTVGELEIYSTTNGWRLYGFDGGATYDSVDLADGGRVRVGKWENGKLVGTFTVEPWALTEAEASACLGGEASGYSAWADAATNRTTSAGILFGVAAAPNDTSGVEGGIWFELSYHGPGDVDYEEMWPTDEDHYWSPRYGLPHGAWEDPGNWITFPLAITIRYDDAGEWRTLTTMVNSMERLDRLMRLNNLEYHIPPYPYVYPVLKTRASFECAKFGHVWVACRCAVCGEEREHDFEFLGENVCATCKNLNTDRRRTDDGEWEVYETVVKCGALDDKGLVDLHAGWHHLDMLGDYGAEMQKFCCSCACGFFAPDAVLLAHYLEEDPGIDASWYDDTTHQVWSTCERCGFSTYKLEQHVPDFSEISSMGFIDDHEHTAVGTCEKCEGPVDGIMSHAWGYYGYDEYSFCRCPCFGADGGPGEDALIHDFGANVALPNPYVEGRGCTGHRFCTRCGADGGFTGDGMEDADAGHSYAYQTNGQPGTEDDVYHYCSCGAYVQRHTDQYFDDKIGVCGACGLDRKGFARGGDPGNDGPTMTDPTLSDPTPPVNDDNPGSSNGPLPDNPKQPVSPDNPDDPDNPDGPGGPNNPQLSDPLFPPFNPTFPGNPNGGNSSTVDPNCRWNTPPWRVTGDVGSGMPRPTF